MIVHELTEWPWKIPIFNKKKEVRAYTLVDEEDFYKFGEIRWKIATSGYAEKTIYELGSSANPKYSIIKLHRKILDAPQGLQVDHINGDPLDNRRSNLRLATAIENGRNKRRRVQRKSPFKGLSETRNGSWQVVIHDNETGKNRHLGVFVDPVEAACAYNLAAKKMYGEFAALNEFTEDDRPVVALTIRDSKLEISGFSFWCYQTDTDPQSPDAGQKFLSWAITNLERECTSTVAS